VSRQIWNGRVIVGLVTVLALFAAPHGNSAEPARVPVRSGVLVGTVENGVAVFKGVPYAAPPVDALRWSLPRPVAPWSGDLPVNEFGPSCMQDEPPRNVPAGSRALQLSEDCLTLNVWSPQAAKNAPVMVWVHGGGNVKGSAADVYCDGTAFARDGIVLVSFNYRLGSFGFQPHNGEANFGLWDQVAVLRWVHDNVAAFGGDPANVTLFGVSAGGQDTLALMTAAAARGLFQKAMVESGGGGWGPPPTMTAAAADHDGDWSPTVDGHLLKEPPLEAFAAGRAARIPLVIGTNSEEGALLGPDPRAAGVFPQVSAADLSRLSRIYGSQASSDAALARLEFRDGYFAGEARWIAAKLASTHTPAYLYRFEYVLGAFQGRRFGAYHGSEVPFVFDHLPPVRRIDDNDTRLTHALHDCWVAFARTGKPDCAEAPGWPQFGPDEKWMVFDSRPAARPVEDHAALDFLQCRLAPPPLVGSTCSAK
jgi:para-nitrobenzyl esterase